MTGQPPYLDLPLGRFLARLASGDPAPSGGGAAALAVSMGAGLCAMAARLSSRQLAADTAVCLMTESERLATGAAALIQADAGAYQGVIEARRQPAPTATPGAARSRPRCRTPPRSRCR